MTFKQDLLGELKQEAAITRKYLERVPFDKYAYQPNEKSESLGRLAIHVAEVVAWWKECLLNDELDFEGFAPKEISTTDQLLAYFDGLVLEAVKVLSESQPEDFTKEWSMRHGATIYFTLPKKQVLRAFCMNHLIHHRAQLGMYLRLLNVPVPATYGPSADDEEVITINRYE